MYISALHQLELRWFAQPLLYSRRDQEKVAPFVVAYRSKGSWNPCKQTSYKGIPYQSSCARLLKADWKHVRGCHCWLVVGSL